MASASFPSSSSLSSSSSSSSSFSSSTTFPCKYDVFLSFRGKDVGTNFIDHLDNSLRQKGVFTFKEDRELEKGKAIVGEIEKAIDQSAFSIVVFSENYADSACCLNELLLIYKRMKQESSAYRVFPVFYHVDPARVQELTGSYGAAFAKHEEEFRNDAQKVQRWRDATKEVASVAGWDLHQKPEYEFIQGIVEEILSKLRNLSHRFSSDLEGIVKGEYYLEKMSSYICEGQSNEVRIVGICGMAGIGKTTIAGVVYRKMAWQFEGSCFLENVREVYHKNGLAYLQEKLLHQIFKDRGILVANTYSGMNEMKNMLRYKRIVIILDDVDDAEQLKFLAGRRDWFAAGSIIVITTRDEHLLSSYGVDATYKVEGLNHEEAFQLFCMKAFKDGSPKEEYMELSHQFVNYCNCLPLALTVLGGHVCGRSVEEWKSVLYKLRKSPSEKIIHKLRISFDGLESEEKSIFLDVACFLSGEHIDHVTEVLESCGFCPRIALSILKEKFLIVISDDLVWMHDLLKQMGQEIVKREHKEPGKRSRIWLYKDIYHVMMNNTGTEQVEGIVLNQHEQDHGSKQISGQALVKMTNLRLLKLKNLELSGGLEYLSSVRYLECHGYLSKSLSPTFYPEDLVSLCLPHSGIIRLWKGIKPLQMLKIIDLSYSVNLIETPDFRGTPNLEKLNFEGCKRLSRVHPSIGVLKRIMYLNLNQCRRLQVLPDEMCDLKSLKTLELLGCQKLSKLPERFEELTSLQELSIGVTARRELLSSRVPNYLLPWRLLPWNRPNFRALMLPSLSALCSLKHLYMIDCNLTERMLPNDFSYFPMLETLNLCANDFEGLPPSIGQLSRLIRIFCDHCERLRSLPELPSSIEILNLRGCPSLETLPPMSRLSELHHLWATDCKRLKSLTGMSRTMQFLLLERCTSLEYIPNPLEIRTSGLRELTFIDCPKLGGAEGALAWLKGYFHSLLKSRYQVPLSPELSAKNISGYSDNYFCLLITGSRIPRWFEHQGPVSSLRVRLPHNWCSDKWMGFCICAVLKVADSPFPKSFTNLVGGLYACTKPCQSWFLSNCHAAFHLKDLELLWFIFIAKDNSRSIEWWNTFNHFAFDSLRDDDSEVKYCGFRLVYEEDIEEITQCNGLSEDAGFTFSRKNNFSKRNRSHEDDCENQVELTTSVNFLKFVFLDDLFKQNGQTPRQCKCSHALKI